MFFLAVLLISEFIVTLSILRFLLYSIVSWNLFSLFKNRHSINPILLLFLQLCC
jgi:hypothetical protein